MSNNASIGDETVMTSPPAMRFAGGDVTDQWDPKLPSEVSRAGINQHFTNLTHTNYTNEVTLRLTLLSRVSSGPIE